MKRFYKNASLSPMGAGFEIHLDGRPVRTPGGLPLCAPTRPLADAVLGEWAAQGPVIMPDEMPLTQILATLIETDAPRRAAITTEILHYLDTDLLCYRAAAPLAVAELQTRQWDQWLTWFENAAGVRLVTTTELAALHQPAAAHAYAATRVRAASAAEFTVLQNIAALGGSLVLALAFVGGAVSPETLFQAIQLEELYRNALYNEAVHGQAPQQEKAHESLRRDLKALAFFLSATRSA